VATNAATLVIPHVDEIGQVEPLYHLKRKTIPKGKISSKQVLFPLFSFDHAPSELRSRITNISKVWKGSQDFGLDYAAIAVAGEIFNKKNKSMGSWYREILFYEDGRTIVNHADFGLKKSVQGQGFARAFLSHLERGYRRNGVSAIYLRAAGRGGSYAWAREGFAFSLEDHEATHQPSDSARGAGIWWETDAKRAAAKLVKEGKMSERAMKALEKRIYKGMIDTNLSPTPKEISTIGSSRTWKEGEKTLWAGKQLLLKSPWDGIKILDARAYYLKK
jgi:GNAT superfamily N-acetyltransferase